MRGIFSSGCKKTRFRQHNINLLSVLCYPDWRKNVIFAKTIRYNLKFANIMIKRLSFLFMLIAAALNVNAQEITAGEHTRVNTVYGPVEGYLDGS